MFLEFMLVKLTAYIIIVCAIRTSQLHFVQSFPGSTQFLQSLNMNIFLLPKLMTDRTNENTGQNKIFIFTTVCYPCDLNSTYRVSLPFWFLKVKILVAPRVILQCLGKNNKGIYDYICCASWKVPPLKDQFILNLKEQSKCLSCQGKKLNFR